MEPYQFLHKRNIGDQFMNENNKIITSVLACNNNVNCADRKVIYYTTYYGTKHNQQEEALPYLSICQSLHERIMKQHLAQQEHPDPDYDPDAPDSVEGFRRLISAMYAHTGNNVLSATMAHLLLSQDNRFSFSHDFVFLPLPHLITWSENEDETLLHFTLRTVLDEEKQRIKVQDKFINDILYKPPELSNVCCYEMLLWYKKFLSKEKEIELKLQQRHC